MTPFSAVYGGVARLRRSWYARRPDARRVLSRPVISVGNLTVGGSGKTPVVAYLARELRALGHRPAILSRGYGRRERTDGVVVVSEGAGPLVAVERSGDEPQMLARELPGVAVLVSPDRYLAGRLAEQHGCTVHLLDDGFQHVQLARTVDLLIVDAADLADRVLPSGRLREPIDAARAADALLTNGTIEDGSTLASTLGVPAAFAILRTFGRLRHLDGRVAEARPATVVAVAGVARPERFFSAVREIAGVRRTFAFRDHHWFTAHDIARIEDAARAEGVDAIVTTAKDAVRLESMATDGFPWMYLPMEASVVPADAFLEFVRSRL